MPTGRITQNLLPLLITLILGSTFAFADSKVYQTAPKPAKAPKENFQFEIPLIEVDPTTGRHRVYITPQFSESDENNSFPIHVARTLYPATPTDLTSTHAQLHQQMLHACPEGWVKLSEWTEKSQNKLWLHYQFQCLPLNRRYNARANFLFFMTFKT